MRISKVGQALSPVQVPILCLLLAAPACAQSLQRAETLWRAHDYDGANNEFKALIAANPKNAEYRVRWGDLFFERFNPEEANNLYNEALALDPKNARAFLGIAEVLAEDFNGKANEAADKALEVEPKLYQAHELKARIALEDDAPEKAAEQADEALKIQPDAVQAIAIHAAMDLLADKQSTWLAKINNRAKGYETVAHFFVINRRYEDGIAYYRKAIAADPEFWSAHSQLGVNLMRLGREGEAYKELELAYDNHFRDKPTVNTLRLMDTYKNFKTYETNNTILKLDKKEAEALRPYFEQAMKDNIALYEKKYQYRLNGPVQVEVYPNHDDFAVRTLGMPGLGALGVTFDAVVAMDSPSGGPPGSEPGTIHWASTLRHEMSHVFILKLTNDRVPRWFTEGVAVHEETATTPDWGDRITPEIITAIRDKKLLPVSGIDRGFVHPEFPAQVIVSYFEAGKMCDFIAQRWGESKLLDMAHEFAKNVPTVQVIKDQLGIEPEQFDKDFLAEVDKETGNTVKNFEAWTKGLGEVNKLARQADAKPEDVITKARALETDYPDYVEIGNPYLIVAKACIAINDKKCALDEYAKYAKNSGREADAIKQYASLLDESGRPKDAEAALERLNYVNPLDKDLHQKLGDLYLKTGNAPLAVREFETLVALHPIDEAGSHYNLAKAFNAQGQKDKAREEALNALEAAPNYKPAQKLLLEVSGDGTSK